MLTRREFLRASGSVASSATVTLLLTSLGCSAKSGYGSGTSTDTTQPACDGVLSTSSVVGQHTHEVCVPAGALTSPPAAGVTLATTPGSSDGHTHTVTLSASQLATIAAGQMVLVDTSTSEGHIHAFSIVRTSAVPEPTGGGSSGAY